MLPEEIRKQIMDMKNCGKTVSEISKTLGVKYATVRFIVKHTYEKRKDQESKIKENDKRMY